MTTSTRSSFAAPRAALLALALAAACGARGGGSFLTTTDGGASSNTDGAATTPTDAGSAVTPGTCGDICRRLRTEPSCGADGAASCENNCEQSIVVAPSRCAASVGALLACARTAAPMCSDAVFPFPSCAAQFSAYASCVVAATDAGTVTPPRDSGTTTSDPCVTATNCADCTARSSCGWCANRCWSGSSSGPTGGSCGDSSWAWTSNMCSSTPPQDSGVSPTISPACQGCALEACAGEVPACIEDSACGACLAGPTPACAGNPRFAALFGCACEACEACAPACGAFR